MENNRKTRITGCSLQYGFYQCRLRFFCLQRQFMQDKIKEGVCFKMMKRIVAVFMAMLVTMSFQAGSFLTGSTVYGEEKKEINIVIDGEKLAFSQDDGMGVPFIDSAGRTQLPVRKPLEKIGATVSFEVDKGSGEKNIIISKDTVSVKLTVRSQVMRVDNDTIYRLDTFPEIRDNRTYLPLRAVFEVLGYSVSWDQASMTIEINKLQKLPSEPIAVSESAVTPAGQFELPRDRSTDEDRLEVIVNHGYIYYVGQDDSIMQTAFSDLTKSKKIYDCPPGMINLFNDENGRPRLFYYTDGASMGSPHQFVLNTNGSLTELNGSRDYAGEVYSTGGKTFAFRDLKFGNDSRLEMKDEKGVYVNLGGRENRYDNRSELFGCNGRRGVYLLGDNLYLMAEPLNGDAGKAVYRVNIKTDEAVRITDAAKGMQIEGNYLYYNKGKEIWKRNLEDGAEIAMYQFENSATDSIYDFAVLNGNLYLVNGNLLFSVPGSERGKDIIACYDMALRGDNGEYLVCQVGKTDIETGSGSEGMMVYDKSGKLIMERTGKIKINSVSIEGNKICYYDKTTNKINVEEIK